MNVWYIVIHSMFAVAVIWMLYIGRKVDILTEQRKFNEKMGYIWKDF